MSGAYSKTIPMIEYRGGGEYNLYGFDLEVGDEMSWGVCRGCYSAPLSIYVPKNYT